LFVPAIYIVLLLGVAVVLAFVLEFLAVVSDIAQAPASVSGDQRSYPVLDRRVLLRLAAASSAAAFLLLVGIIAAYLIDWDRASLLLAWPKNHPCSFLLLGAAFYLVSLTCGVKPRQPVLLLCLALPGLLVAPLFLATDIFIHDGMDRIFILTAFAFFVQPGQWLLLIIAIGQARVLRKAGGEFAAGGLVRILLISVAYLFGFLV